MSKEKPYLSLTRALLISLGYLREYEPEEFNYIVDILVNRPEELKKYVEDFEKQLKEFEKQLREEQRRMAGS
jgi:polyhydroxyalkanoate synthesis regulator phasin